MAKIELHKRYLARSFRKVANMLHHDAVAEGEKLTSKSKNPYRLEFKDGVHELSCNEMSENHYKMGGNWIPKEAVLWDEVYVNEQTSDNGYLIIESLVDDKK